MLVRKVDCTGRRQHGPLAAVLGAILLTLPCVASAKRIKKGELLYGGKGPLADFLPPCDIKLVRRGIANYGRAKLFANARWYHQQFVERCSELASDDETRAALANDMAFLAFEEGSDELCLQTLAESLETQNPKLKAAAAFNRILCGGACQGVPAAVAEKAQKRRSDELELRRLRQPRRHALRPLCDPRDEGGEGRGIYLTPDLKGWTMFGPPDGILHRPTPEPVIWLGDLNGDGYGDFVGSSFYLSCGNRYFYPAWGESFEMIEVTDKNHDGLVEFCYWRRMGQRKPSACFDFLESGEIL